MATSGSVAQPVLFSVLGTPPLLLKVQDHTKLGALQVPSSTQKQVLSTTPDWQLSGLPTNRVNWKKALSSKSLFRFMFMEI